MSAWAQVDLWRTHAQKQQDEASSSIASAPFPALRWCDETLLRKIVRKATPAARPVREYRLFGPITYAYEGKKQ